MFGHYNMAFYMDFMMSMIIDAILYIRNLEFFIIHNCDMNYECNQWKRELTLSNVFRNG